MKYISICKSPACLNFLILKLETLFIIYKKKKKNRFQHSSFVSDARTGFVTVNTVIFLASQFSFNLYLFTDKIQCWKLFLKV